MHPHTSDMPLIAQVGRLQFQLMHQFLTSVGLFPGQFFVLQLLGEKEKPMSQKEIGSLLYIKPSSVNQIIVNLEKASFITRCPDEKDKRVMRVTITEKGAEVLIRAKEKFAFIQEATRKGISDEDMKTFDRISTQMRDNLKDMQ